VDSNNLGAQVVSKRGGAHGAAIEFFGLDVIKVSHLKSGALEAASAIDVSRESKQGGKRAIDRAVGGGD
jgi:hypothetical protein